MQSAWGVARVAEELAAQGALVKGDKLVPIYHRLSQAERERLERENHTNRGDCNHV
jgi:tRNA threonylcarbamoyladenosine biosynthesis protein TsaB